ncbi:transcriptional regulator, AraC family [Magnetococcus marinus MC-1]|uniref:Transcriptional regulator, AraC family n=2 Tax=Magnetococcus TaxID=162171 RepID=A0L4Q6_MAGMM|nr:transcriptional regulator, AraC family [Magnetococcus marinus MC-1]
MERMKDKETPILSREWSLDSGYSSNQLPEEAHPGFPPHVGQETLSHIDLGEGCDAFHYRGQAFHRLHIKVRIETDEPFLMIRAPLAGVANFNFEGVGQTEDSPDRINLFVHGNPEDACISTHPAHEAMDVVGIMLSASRLLSLCDGMKLPRPLEALSGPHAANAMASLTMSTTSRRLFKALVATPYAGALSRLYGESKLMEIAAAILTDLGAQAQESTRLLGKEQAKIKQACEYLRSKLTDLPSQERLANLVGLSQRQLATAFRQFTGMTMPEWILERRMEMAADMLRSGELAIKQIAFQLGYAQVSGFTTAFSRHFGMAPADFRKSISGT